ncbi:hypothetical protein DH2020_047338 [Rehmannia glutinosa]|uniref:Myb/SANT-like DNA-binding domain-containing protein n=1 Tax=Rehmannia glutinosa TaxID=99300 RepID=A0ABR0U9N6_REHGL
MMLGVSGLMGSSGDGAADAHESGGASGGSSEVGASSSIPGGGGMEEIERSGGGGGNRWPRQETLALLKIRSDMDVTFRDSSLKGPLWEEVSGSLSFSSFHKNSAAFVEFCSPGFRPSVFKNGGAWISTKRQEMQREFENVFKYHKRTKDGRASKSDGKTYRFFDQLEALENTPPPPFNPPPPRPAVAIAPPPPMPTANANSLPMPSHTTHVSSSTSPNPISVAPPAQTAINSSPFQLQSQPPFQPPPPPAAMNTSNPPQIHTFHQPSHPHIRASLLSNSTSTSSTSSDEDIQRRRGRRENGRIISRG